MTDDLIAAAREARALMSEVADLLQRERDYSTANPQFGRWGPALRLIERLRNASAALAALAALPRGEDHAALINEARAEASPRNPSRDAGRKNDLIRRLADALVGGEERLARYQAALEFYADPETYFALMIVADPPCGDFANDFTDVWWEPAQDHKPMPGARAREALAEPVPTVQASRNSDM